jgi:hypothetical protein
MSGVDHLALLGLYRQRRRDVRGITRSQARRQLCDRAHAQPCCTYITVIASFQRSEQCYQIAQARVTRYPVLSKQTVRQSNGRCIRDHVLLHGQLAFDVGSARVQSGLTEEVLDAPLRPSGDQLSNAALPGAQWFRHSPQVQLRLRACSRIGWDGPVELERCWSFAGLPQRHGASLGNRDMLVPIVKVEAHPASALW